MKLPASEKGRGKFRTREERFTDMSDASEMPGGFPPTPPLAAKQQGIDRLLDLSRRAGFKNLAFSAEPGERPRLYQKLLGYKFKEEGPEDIQSMLARMPGREPSTAPGVPEYGASRVHWARNLSPQSEMSEPMLENALMLSADEAVEYGLATRAGNRFRLTAEGVADIRKALEEMGAAVDWFGEGVGR
jgi:hypothetical protein